jgi:hypothetical protein
VENESQKVVTVGEVEAQEVPTNITQPIVDGEEGKLFSNGKGKSKGGREADLSRIEALIPKLHAHMENDALIKGWEADKRILCNGKQRAPLRAAARDIRMKAVIANVKRAETDEQRRAIAAMGRAEHASLLPPERAYLTCIGKLYDELAKAYEQDFDAHLRDGLEWCAEVQSRLLSGKRNSGSRACENEIILTATPTILPAVFEQVQGKRLLADLHSHRASGHHGRAIDRDLKEATCCASKARELWRKMQDISGTMGAIDGTSSDLQQMQLDYISWISKLLVQLRREGEPDFDGMLRNAINFLENCGNRVCY